MGDGIFNPCSACGHDLLEHKLYGVYLKSDVGGCFHDECSCEKYIDEGKQMNKADAGGVQVKVGDVVKLNSGGPQMTVEELVEANGVKKIQCIWFSEGSGEFMDAIFLPGTLTFVSPVKVDEPTP